MKEYTSNDVKKITFMGVAIVLIGIGLIIFFGSWFIVEVGEVGVTFNQMTGVTKSNSQGFHLKMPLIESVTKFDVKTQKIEVRADGASKDIQTVVLDVVLNYHLEYEKVNELFTKVGDDYCDKVITPAISEMAKLALSLYPVEEIISKREELKEKIHKNLLERLAQYNIILENTNLTDIDFTKEFNDIVEKKQIEEQKIKTAEYQKKQAEQFKQKTILEAEGEARKQELIKQTVTDKIIDLEWIKKWDGRLPQTMLGDKTMFMVTPGKEK
ncbi:MAG: prohibitin family protein [Candidatus Firestonebacteria bacterium]